MSEFGITVGEVCGIGNHEQWIRDAMKFPNLCFSCSSITVNIDNFENLISADGLRIEITLRALQDSIAKHRCRLCVIFLGIALHSINDKKIFDTLFNEFLSVYGNSLTKVKLKVRLKPEDSRISSWDFHDFLIYGEIVGLYAETLVDTYLRFKVYASSYDRAAKFISTRECDLDMGSNTAYSQIRRWISDCNKHHQECEGSNQTDLPTRVLDLFIGDDPEDLRLLITHGERDRYVALSYCWGGLQQTKTTSLSLEDKCTHIAKSSLPLTIQDAIIVTRQIGIRYLWVDSLCIIQDSAKDKEVEIGRMADIYQNSYLTISAASARSSIDGFLAPKLLPRCLEGPFEQVRFQLPFSCPEGEIGTITLDYSHFWEKSLSPEPLDHRAWAMQERILSKRVLIYGTSTLTWHCENSILGWNSWLRHHQKISIKLRKGDEELHKLTWRNLVAMYSRCQLTLSEDKLPAISGLAGDVMSKSKPGQSPGRYLAGIWESDLLNSLTWCTSLNQSRNVRDFQYRAPTWSWASVDSPVIFLHRFNEISSQKGAQERLEVLDCYAVLRSDISPFGQVSRGLLRVRGRLVAGANILEPWKWSPGIFQSPTPAVVLKLDDFRDGDEAAVSRAQSSWWIQVYHQHGLILEKINEGTYKRVGCVVFQNWENLIAEQEVIEIF